MIYLKAKKANSVMPLNKELIESLVISRIPDAEVRVADIRGDGEAWTLHVTAPALDSLSRLDRHRLVWRALEGSYDDTKDILSLSVTPHQVQR